MKLDFLKIMISDSTFIPGQQPLIAMFGIAFPRGPLTPAFHPLHVYWE